MRDLNKEERITRYVADAETRRLFIRNHLKELIALQIRLLRKKKGWSQAKLGEHAGGMKQPRIAILEDPDRSSAESIATLLRIADAFDVGLVVSYVPPSEFVRWAAALEPERLTPLSYREEQQQQIAHDIATESYEERRVIPFLPSANAYNHPYGEAHAIAS